MEEKYDFKAASSYHKEWSTYVFDVIGEPISIFLIKYTKMTPNQASLLSLFFALMGGFFFIKGGYQNQLIGAGFAFLYNIFDMIDGRIARARRESTLYGKWLDAMIDFVVFPYLIFTLAFGMGTYLAAVVGMLAIVSYQTHYLIVHFYKSEIQGNRNEIELPGKFEWLRYIYGSNIFYVFLPIALIFNAPMYVLLFWAIFGNLYWFLIIYVQHSNIRKEK